MAIDSSLAGGRLVRPSSLVMRRCSTRWRPCDCPHGGRPVRRRGPQRHTWSLSDFVESLCRFVALSLGGLPPARSAALCRSLHRRSLIRPPLLSSAACSTAAASLNRHSLVSRSVACQPFALLPLVLPSLHLPCDWRVQGTGTHRCEVCRGCRGGNRNCRPGIWILKNDGNCWILRNAGSCILRARILHAAAASRIPPKARILDVGRPGADSGFCRSIQNPPKRADSGCWETRRGFWILPQHPESPKRRGFWMLGATRRGFWILPQHPASRIQHPRTAHV